MKNLNANAAKVVVIAVGVMAAGYIMNYFATAPVIRDARAGFRG